MLFVALVLLWAACSLHFPDICVWFKDPHFRELFSGYHLWYPSIPLYIGLLYFIMVITVACLCVIVSSARIVSKPFALSTTVFPILKPKLGT